MGWCLAVQAVQLGHTVVDVDVVQRSSHALDHTGDSGAFLCALEQTRREKKGNKDPTNVWSFQSEMLKKEPDVQSDLGEAAPDTSHASTMSMYPQRMADIEKILWF